MSKKEAHYSQNELTPQELANKCSNLILEIMKLEESNNHEDNWAKDAFTLGEKLHNEDHRKYGIYTTVVKTSVIKEKLPELWKQVIEPAIKIANKKSDMYKEPEEPSYIILDNYGTNCSYNANHHAIVFGIDYIESRESIDEIVSVASHEWGHAHQKLQYRMDNRLVRKGNLQNTNSENCCKPFHTESNSPHYVEYSCDRHSSTRQLLSNFLSDIIKDKKLYNYEDFNSSHPNHRKRIKMLLAEMLGNEIFGMNGVQFIDNKENIAFFPNHVMGSNKNIQNKVRQNIGYDRVPPVNMDITITEDGKLVKNYQRIDFEINRKSKELIEKLDDLVRNGISRDQKFEWLGVVDKEVAQFKEKHKPEFVEGKEIPLGGWQSKITLESCSPKRQNEHNK